MEKGYLLLLGIWRILHIVILFNNYWLIIVFVCIEPSFQG